MKEGEEVQRVSLGPCQLWWYGTQVESGSAVDRESQRKGDGL